MPPACHQQTLPLQLSRLSAPHMPLRMTSIYAATVPVHPSTMIHYKTQVVTMIHKLRLTSLRITSCALWYNTAEHISD